MVDVFHTHFGVAGMIATLSIPLLRLLMGHLCRAFTSGVSRTGRLGSRVLHACKCDRGKRSEEAMEGARKKKCIIGFDFCFLSIAKPFPSCLTESIHNEQQTWKIPLTLITSKINSIFCNGLEQVKAMCSLPNGNHSFLSSNWMVAHCTYNQNHQGQHRFYW
jgi:hypothetical protein